MTKTNKKIVSELEEMYRINLLLEDQNEFLEEENKKLIEMVAILSAKLNCKMNHGSSYAIRIIKYKNKQKS